MNYVKEKENYVWAECVECGMIMKFKKAELNSDYYSKAYRLSDTVECFCGEQSDIITSAPIEQKPSSAYTESAYVSHYSAPTRNVPHCPTCGSENVTKISLGSKAVGGAMFGIFSSNVRNSYKWNNCGCKW